MTNSQFWLLVTFIHVAPIEPFWFALGFGITSLIIAVMLHD